MKNALRKDAERIYNSAITENLPDAAVEKALAGMTMPAGRLILVAIGKAAWQMARKAEELLSSRIDSGVVITKHHHSRGAIGNLEIYEAGHPVPDECGIRATKRALDLVSGLSADDTVLFLVSGGGSALFECVDIPLSELAAITSHLLASGASIGEINTVRKHLSEVKGGRFAARVAPASVYGVVLSDVIGDRLDVIASGPAAADLSTAAEVKEIIEKYDLPLSEKARELIMRETPKRVDNATHTVSGSVSELCLSAVRTAESLGYKTQLISTSVTDEAREVGSYLGDLAVKNKDTEVPLAFILGGETVVHLTGHGKGGRNQELALAAALKLSGVENACVFSVGSDGTDGPTDAAGGYADSDTARLISSHGKDAREYLKDNDAYNALSLSGGLIMTGPTGTNVNDLSVLLILPGNKNV